MPREKITPTTPGVNPHTPSPEVHVGWQRDLDSIQVGIMTPITGRPDYEVDDQQESIVAHLFRNQQGQVGAHLRDLLATEGLAITDERADSENRVRTGDTIDNLLGSIIIEALDRTASHVSLFANLDRREANDLIRTIRKGRDAACGRDE